MPGPHHERILASTALSLMLAAPLGALAQDSNEPAATFNERFPADHTSPQPAQVKKEQQNVVATTRALRIKRPRSRVVVVARSFLNVGTNVGPGERKFLDYAFPPTHAALDVVSNTGGRVGWHNSPLPGPFFPQ
jgi:hypothetical protein